MQSMGGLDDRLSVTRLGGANTRVNKLPADVGAPGKAAEVGRALQEWWPSQQRRFPWRTVPERYPVVVAEILLQQTRAETVARTWVQVLARYPSVGDLADGDPAELGEMVAILGLGTQRTGRLISAARAMTSGSGRIPGLGAYGSGVVALVSGDVAGPVPVDANIARVVTRVWGLRFDRGEARKKLEVIDRTSSILAAASTPATRLSLIYALVDLGAMVCKSTSPSCASCPLLDGCLWAQASSDSSRTRAISPASARPSGGGTASDMSRI